MRCGCVPDSRTLAHQRSLLATVGWLVGTGVAMSSRSTYTVSQSVSRVAYMHTYNNTSLLDITLPYPTYSAADIWLWPGRMESERERRIMQTVFYRTPYASRSLLTYTPGSTLYTRIYISDPSMYLYFILYIHGRVNIYSTYHSRERTRERNAGHGERGHNSKHIARVVSKRPPRSPSCSFMARVRCH